MTMFDQPLLPTVVLLAAPPAPVRHTLHDWLAAALPSCRIVSAAEPDDARRLAGALHPALALVDIDTPSARGFQLIRSLRRDSTGTKIVALSTYHADLYSEHALAAGATACVSLQRVDSGLADLLQALVPVNEGLS